VIDAQSQLLTRSRYEAEVISLSDPKNWMRVQVKILGLFDGVADKDCPWATYHLPVGFRANDGDFTPCDAGDMVWVEFPYSTHGRPDTRRPMITGSVHFCPDGTPNFPHESFGGVDKLTHTRPPELPAAVTVGVHEGKVYTQHGTTIESLEGGTWRVVNRATGAFIEIRPDGSMAAHTVANDDKVVGGNDTKTIKGNRGLKVAGDQAENVTGNDAKTVGGNLSETVSGNSTETVTGSKNVTAASVTMTASGVVTFNGSQIKLNNGTGVVTGECICALTGLPHSDISTTVIAGK